MLDEKLGDLDSNLESSSNILGDLFFIRCSVLDEVAFCQYSGVALTNAFGVLPSSSLTVYHLMMSVCATNSSSLKRG